MGDRDPNNDADWETYLSELDGYQIDRYLELYKEAGRIVSNEGLGEVDTGSSDDTSSTAETSESSVAEESSTVESSAVESSAVESAAE